MCVMAVREILSFDHPVLRQKARKVARVDTAIVRLLDDLGETMYAAPGAGLAANQIGVPLRACVVKGDENQHYGLVNPVLVKGEGSQVGYEGCLSFPGWVGEVERFETVVVKGLNRKGKEVRIKADGFTARAFLHELDHLDGVLFTDRLTRPETGVVVAYGQIIPRSVLEIPPRGVLNVHGSLLPRYRGAAPVAHAILRGEPATGVTIMQMDERLDHGPILATRETAIGPHEDAAALTGRLAALGAELLVETIAGLDEIDPVPQDHHAATLAPKLAREDGELEWDLDAAEIDRRVRGLQPWPGVTLPLAGGRVKVLRGRPLEGL